MSHFKLSYKTIELELAQPFTISRGTKKTVKNVFVQLESNGIAGYGEAAPNKRYDEDADSVVAYLDAIPEHFFDGITAPDQLSVKLDNYSKKNKEVKSAEVAVEMAWLDWWGKSQNKSLAELLGAPSLHGPQTSYTIGLDEIDVMQQKVLAAPEFPIYKVKLGTSRDREIIKGIREVTDKPIYVDANEGWESMDEAKSNISFLANQSIDLVEQPMPAHRLEDMKQLKKYSPLPLCADESFQGNESLKEIAKAFDIINIKLMKTGSIIKSLNIIKKAKELELKVMIGCMIESSLANSAGGLLSLWADYADLDGHLLIKNDPASALILNDDKHITISDEPGLGVKVRFK